MYYWRVTKYNPMYRDRNDTYVHNEWTSFSDIGKCFEGEQLTLDEYLTSESAYIDVVISSMSEANLKNIKISELEKTWDMMYADVPDLAMEKFYDSLRNGMSIPINEIAILVKLLLREKVWGKLVSDELEIHFGYDYYMYICSKDRLENTEVIIKTKGLFAENVKSPYMECD